MAGETRMSTIQANAILDASGGNTTTINGVTPNTDSVRGRNLIINGAMQVAQRGTSSTGVTGNGYYTVDRFAYNQSGADQLAFTISQDSNAPDGFTKSFKMETTTAETTVDSTEYYMIRYKVEAQDVQHLKHGTSEAKQVTVSFWAKSSIASTYALYLYKPNIQRIIGSTYTINSANTWEYKTITFAGDTGGGINDGNIEGLHLSFILGAGSDMADTDNTSWSAYSTGNLAYGHAANSLVTTVGATWQITGVKLEVGSVATEFDHRSYAEELQLCKRYFNRWNQYGEGPGFGNALVGIYNNANTPRFQWKPTVELRAAPTVTKYGANSDYDLEPFDRTPTAITALNSYRDSVDFSANDSTGGTQGHACWLVATNGNAYIDFDSEL